MKKILSIFLLLAFTFNLATQNAAALSTIGYKQVGNTNILYKYTDISNDVKLYDIKEIGGSFTSKIYEKYEDDVLIYDIYEADIHNVMKIHPNGKIEVDDIVVHAGNTAVVVNNETKSIPNNESLTMSTGTWHTTYSLNILGGTASGYNDNITLQNINAISTTQAAWEGFAVSTICNIIFTAAFGSNTLLALGASTALGLFQVVATYLKSSDKIGADGNAYLSFSKRTATNNDVNNVLAYYYEHIFSYYSLPNCQGTHILINGEPTSTVYEMYFFN